jgi:hypothetical protein
MELLFWGQEELEDEEVWNGDVDSAEEEGEDEVPAQTVPQNVQRQHHR